MSKYRVMVVDDDPDIRFVTCGLLELDFETVQAESGLDALEKIERYEPDLVLLDISMPIMDGFATCRSIRRHDDFGEMPVFFLTALTNPESRQTAETVGCQGYIEKPFNTEALVESIRHFFYERRVPPGLKTFNMRELAKIDATPLRASEAAKQQEENDQADTGPISPNDSESDEKPKIPTHKRRVFGVPKAAPPKPPEPEKSSRPSQASTRALRLPPREELLHPSEPKSAPPPEPPSTAPLPPHTPEPPAKPLPRRPDIIRSSPPPAPAPSSPEPKPAAASLPESKPRSSTQEVLAKLKKQQGGLKIRPRVLCLIDDRNEFTTYTFAFKGLAEFLPLEDPVEAVEIIARFQPDIVFLRGEGNGYNGLQLVQLLQGNPRLSHTEIVFLTTGRETPAMKTAMGRLSTNTDVRVPLDKDIVRRMVERIKGKPTFSVRDKKFPYGTYVNEVLQKVRKQADIKRAAREHKAFSDKHAHLANYLESELKDYANNIAPPKKTKIEALEYYVQ